MRFIDEVEIRVVSGRGGDGYVSFRREKFVPFGGPDGGEGGKGGSVRIRAVRGMSTLSSLRGRRVYAAQNGAPGARAQRTGRSGQDKLIPVPLGTLVRDMESGALLADLTEDGQEAVVVRGGRGGKGNMALRTATNRAPRHAEQGGSAQERQLHLELRLLADVGVVGFPNAGKSTFVARVSAARPRIADYPFTTLVPNLGVVDRGVDGSWVVADVPGLIEGAAQGAGLGHRFLRHVQRTRLLLHLVAATADEAHDPLTRYRILSQELREFDPALARRPQVVALSKTDAVDEARLQALLAELREAGVGPVFCFSAVSGQGLQGLLDEIWARLQNLEGPS